MLVFSARTAARRIAALATATVALLALAAGPALAAGGYASVQRGFGLSGDRDALSIVAKVTQGAPGSGLGVGVGFGTGEAMDSLVVNFVQGTAKAGSRGLKVEGYSGEYKAVSGTGCDYAYRLSCNRPGYDWVQGRAYKVSFVRGARNASGWLWTVSIKDLSNGDSTKLVSLRAPFDKLHTGGMNGAYLYSNIGDCTDVTPVAAVVSKPTGAGTSVSWDGKLEKYNECDGRATLGAPVDSGKVKFKIS